MRMNLYQKTDIPMKIAVFASGSGTNFEKILEKHYEYCKSGKGNYASIVTVFSNNPDSGVLKKAESSGINTICLSSSKFFSLLEKPPDDELYRETYDSAVIALLEQNNEPDLIVLAGYRRKLSRLFTDRYRNRIINLYPGDITRNYLERGIPAYRQALDNGDSTLRCTCYIENDTNKRFGSAIAQSADIPLNGFSENDNEKLEEKIRKEGEWLLFPFVVHDLIANGRVEIDEQRNVYIDGVKMEESGLKL